MFYESKKFNENIAHWNISNVETMYKMFFKAANFRQNLCSWTDDYKSFPDKVGTVNMLKDSKCGIPTTPTDVNVCQGCFFL